MPRGDGTPGGEGFDRPRRASSKLHRRARAKARRTQLGLAAVPGGRMQPEDLKELGDLADEYGTGRFVSPWSKTSSFRTFRATESTPF